MPSSISSGARHHLRTGPHFTIANGYQVAFSLTIKSLNPALAATAKELLQRIKKEEPVYEALEKAVKVRDPTAPHYFGRVKRLLGNHLLGL